MSSPLFPARPLPRHGALNEWLNRIASVLVVVAIGVLLGQQYMAPDKRVLAVAAAVIVIGTAWRLDMVSGVGVLVLALPFPRGTTFGSTNLALILLLLVIWLLRMSQRELPRPRPTPADPALGAFFLMVVVSFYNVANARHLYFALQNFQLFVGTVILFYLVVNTILTVADLRRLHRFYGVMALLIYLVAIFELNNPGKPFIPGWIEFTATRGSEFNTKNVRVGSIFYDYELLADFSGLNLLLWTFLYAQARHFYERLAWAALGVLTLFILFATVTRGPLVSLSVAGLYLLWMCRRHLKVVPVTIGAAGLLAAFFGMNFYVSSFTRSGDLFARVEGTKMVGWMPDSRAGAWTDAWTRALEHPLIGHGPYYSVEHGLKVWFWPHNLYLYILNAVGFLGLGTFLWLMATFWRISKPQVDSPAHPDYARAYLLIVHAQIVFFMVDQFKIEFWRNPTYQFIVWLMFAFWVAAYRVAPPLGAPAASPVPVPAGPRPAPAV